MQQLSGLDAAFLYMETFRTPMHVASLHVFDASAIGGLSYERFKEHIAGRLHLSRIFRQWLIEVPLNMGHPFWIEDPNFDLDYHIPHMAVPRPGGMPELTRLVAQFMGRPLDLRRPLWEVAFV